TYEVVAEQLWGLPPGAGTDEAVAAIRRHELIARILDHSHHAISIADLAERVLPADHGRQPAETEQFLVHVLGALSHLRATVTAADPNAGRRLPTIEAHLWVRELSRLDRAVRDTVDFHWHDDGPNPDSADTASTPGLTEHHHLPAIFCRHCGRAGWMTSYEPGTEQPTFTPATIRGTASSEPTSTRALTSADQGVLAAAEAALPLSQIRSSQDSPTSLMWLDPRQAKLLSADAHTPSEQDSHIVPVLLHTGITAK